MGVNTILLQVDGWARWLLVMVPSVEEMINHPEQKATPPAADQNQMTDGANLCLGHEPSS